MKIVIDIPEYIYKVCQGHRDPVYGYIAKGTPLPEGAEILTKEAYSDLCTMAADAPNFESKEYIEQRLENYNKLLKFGILDCIKEKSQESEGEE